MLARQVIARQIYFRLVTSRRCLLRQPGTALGVRWSQPSCGLGPRISRVISQQSGWLSPTKGPALVRDCDKFWQSASVIPCGLLISIHAFRLKLLEITRLLFYPSAQIVAGSTFSFAHEKARHVKAGKHKFPPAEAASEGLRDDSSQGGAVGSLQAAADRILSKSSKLPRGQTQPGPSRLDPQPDAAELDEDATGYLFAPECDASAVDIDARVYQLVRTAAGGSGLSRVDIKELLSILIEVVASPGRLTIRSLAEFDKCEEEQLAGANIEPFEQVELTKEGDLRPVIL
ncbi:unnamed protein product [Closterium sp. Yama58-4]|nr:unnamed protein product [Closterium sp. Yama58-4]